VHVINYFSVRYSGTLQSNGVTYRNIVWVYKERSVRIINGIRSSYQNEKPVIEYGPMPNYRDKTKKFIVKYNVLYSMYE